MPKDLPVVTILSCSPSQRTRRALDEDVTGKSMTDLFSLGSQMDGWPYWGTVTMYFPVASQEKEATGLSIRIVWSCEPCSISQRMTEESVDELARTLPAEGLKRTRRTGLDMKVRIGRHTELKWLGLGIYFSLLVAREVGDRLHIGDFVLLHYRGVVFRNFPNSNL